MPHAHIVGIGASVPKRVLRNKDIETFVDTSDEWITRRTGIQERRIASLSENEGTADLGSQAALRALEMAHVSPEDVDMIIVGTATPDNQLPAAACMIQSQINAKNAFAFDVSAGCTGFLYSLCLANDAIRSGSCKTALVIGAERLSSIINWQDRGTCVILADGAGAVVVTGSNEKGGILSRHLQSDGSLHDLLYSSYGNSYVPDILEGLDLKPFQVRMEGNRLFKRAVESMTEAAEKALKCNSLSKEDITLFIPHQANIRIIQAIAKNLDVPMEKVFTNLHKYGNTSAASIPLALDEAYHSGLIKKDDYVLFLAFGAGLTWGSVLVRWSF